MGSGPKSTRVAVIGAGFSGVGLGIALKRAGIHDFVVFDKAERVGGVWRENTYPGAACDAPSHLYSFSFELNPTWSHRYSPQPEILEYIERCVDKYHLADHLHLGIEVTAADFDEERRVWRIETSEGTWEATVLVAGCGQLSRPAYPRIPGIDRFEGKWFHSAHWDHEIDLHGRRVAVVGTGASAIQFVPAIAPEVARMHVFQRTPGWILPKSDRAYTRWHHEVFRRAPALQLAARFGIWAFFESAIPMFTGHPRVRAFFESVARRHMEGQVADPELRAKLTPTYPMGCKRILISNDWYPTMTRPNVELVTDGIREVTATGIVTDDGVSREVDTIILSTGFESGAFVFPVRVTGLGGVDLSDAWEDGASAYLGLTVTGFPNFFIMYGPNTNLGAGSIVYMLESQTRYVVESLRALDRTSASYIDVLPGAHDAFSDEVQRRLAGSVWAGCNSWYRNEAGRIVNNWPGFMSEYRRRTRRINLADYRLAAGKETPAPATATSAGR